VKEAGAESFEWTDEKTVGFDRGSWFWPTNPQTGPKQNSDAVNKANNIVPRGLEMYLSGSSLIVLAQKRGRINQTPVKVT
jgi:hypothetical protein